MYDVSDILNTVERVYDSNTNFQILKDFERVMDELDIYVFENWIDGELASGPDVERHWVTCQFMWPEKKMPNPVGGQRLVDYNCKVKYISTEVTEPRPIRKPEDVRPGTRKGKLDSKPVWVVEIMMPKKLISDIWVGYQEKYYSDYDLLDREVSSPDEEEQPADEIAPSMPEQEGPGDLPSEEDMPNNTGGGM